MTQYGFYFDSSRCTGCKTCELVCKDYHDLGPDILFRRIYDFEGGSWEKTPEGAWNKTAFNYHLAALAEVFADELCGIAPRCKAEPINLTVAILVCLAAVNSHAKARDRNAALCGPKFRISSKPTLKIAAIQH